MTQHQKGIISWLFLRLLPVVHDGMIVVARQMRFGDDPRVAPVHVLGRAGVSAVALLHVPVAPRVLSELVPQRRVDVLPPKQESGL